MIVLCHRLKFFCSRCAVAVIALLSAALLHGAEINARIVDRSGNAATDVVVYATPVSAEPAAIAPTEKPHTATIDQIDKEFVPYVTAVLVGTSIQFPNRDNTRHHVYSFSPAKKFDLPLYAGSAAAPVLFDKPGVIAIGCNIHDWMIGYIDVLETPYFGTTGRSGTTTLKGLPAGDYTVRIWHPDMTDNEAATTKQITLGNQASVDLSWQIGLKPSARRRAPLPAERGY